MKDWLVKKTTNNIIFLALLHIAGVGLLFFIVRPDEFFGVLAGAFLNFIFYTLLFVFNPGSEKEIGKMQAFLDNGEPVDRIIDRGVPVGSKKSIGMVIGALIVFPLIIALSFPLFFWFSMPFVLAGVGLTIHMGIRRNEAIRVNAWNPDEDEDEEIILELSDKVFEIEIADAQINESESVNQIQ